MDAVGNLYQKRRYPAMSHPRADPAIAAVAARLAGVSSPLPATSRILEIGCASGHNLLPIALRWPRSTCTGIDLSAGAIEEAARHAAAVGVPNIDFEAIDLREFSGGPFDYIIAHGVFSWVPDDVKAALLSFCANHLSINGVAVISFNVEAGWAARFPVIAKVKAICQALGADEMAALEALRPIVGEGDPELAVMDDMLAKGRDILAFDDFAPVNDPWPVDRFAAAATRAGLRWLGESDPAENLPVSLSESERLALGAWAEDPLALQAEADRLSQRTFRSGLLCRDDAPCHPPATDVLSMFSFRAGNSPSAPDYAFLDAVSSKAPACVPFPDLPAADPASIIEAIDRGWVLPRIEPVNYPPIPPECPALSPFRLRCASLRLPLVDAWHKPCAFPATHYDLLARIDGSRSCRELAAEARAICPELAFDPWLDHLASRGMFSPE